ncbi:hypothetical protein Cgig2_026324 [Carnegiea gigantea]|uniref:Uncharacterized protein n=1 Tax=Carnegiea gigantea TaxID=171969 RepID=A0A9Q1QGF4_9CARY|nr:hypothetical protein Cgig2_026324 [Carnegiea gigantea]
MERIGESTRAAGADQLQDLSNAGEGDEEEEVEKLEQEVKQMADKLKKYRSTLPDQLKSTLTSMLASQRPILSLPDPDGSEPGTSGVLPRGAESGPGNSSGVLTSDSDEKTPDDVELLRDKISSNISTMPNVLKRMNECISRIDKLVSSNETIHPAFKRKKS